MDTPKKIAYLAPEIPGFSSTFVYNEIFVLQEIGFDIDTFSVHRAGDFSSEAKLKALADKTHYLYEQDFGAILKANLCLLLGNPLTYLCKLCLCFSDMFKLLGKPTLALGVFYRFMVGACLAVQLKKKHVEHLHMHFAHIPTDIGMYAAELSGISYSVTAHANDIFERGWLLKEKISRSKFFATISNFNIDWLVNLGADRNKLHVVRCGVDSIQFSVRPIKAKSSPVVFGFLGRLVEKKGAHILLDACVQLKSDNHNFIVQIVGDGPLEGDLKAKVELLGLQDEVQFLGSKPHSEIASWLTGLDYFVLPCVKDSQGDMDGIPVALMEAMLKGVPVISTDVSGIPELVIDNETGLSARQNDADSLSSIMVKALSEADRDTQLRVKNGESLVRSEYDLSNNAKKLAHLMNQ